MIEGNDHCTVCGNIFISGNTNNYNVGRKSRNKEMDLGEILPGERILGEYSPLYEDYRKFLRKRMMTHVLTITLTLSVGIVSSLGQGGPTLMGKILFSLTYLGVTLFIFLLFISLYILKIRAQFNARYVITSSKIVKIIRNKITMDLPIGNIENAVVTIGINLGISDYTVFFPSKGFLDLKGVNLNTPMGLSRVIQLENIGSTFHSDLSNRKNSKRAKVQVVRRHMREIKKTKKEIMKQSFPFLSKEKAFEAATVYWNLTGKSN